MLMSAAASHSRAHIALTSFFSINLLKHHFGPITDWINYPFGILPRCYQPHDDYPWSSCGLDRIFPMMPFACQTDHNQLLGKGLLRLPPFYAKSCSSICQRPSDYTTVGGLGLPSIPQCPYWDLFLLDVIFKLPVSASICLVRRMQGFVSSTGRPGLFASHHQ